VAWFGARPVVYASGGVDASGHGGERTGEDPMKLVKCIVREARVEATTDALKQLDVSGLTVTHVGGRGRGKNPTAVFRCSEYEIPYRHEMMIDMVVADSIVDDVVKTVIEVARTGQQGDGRVFVIPVEEAYTIRTRCGGPD
jgi:nitrogen regulatory protein P-II 1